MTLRAAQDSEARRLLDRLLAAHEEPMTSEHLNTEFYRTTSALFLQSVYGYELKSSEDQFLTDIIILNSVLNQASLPTGFLVNVFPWMEHIPDWFPGTGWKQTAYQWRAWKDRAIDNVYNWSKQRIINGLDDSSVVSHIYRDARQTGFNEADADDFCKNSTLAMLWFVVAMAMYPDIQEKAQQEIDQIVGTDRLPNVEDRPSLHYVERLLTEIVRWYPSAPFGVPHVCTEENEYRGYRIPKGAVMIGHIRATVREEHVYKDAEEFNPDRFLDPTVPPPQAFGICPGQHFFREMFYIEVVLILATMKVERCKDENGKDIVPTAETTENNVISRPVPFKVKIVPRSEHHAELIRTAV
ncbi:cytochrome P450 family protein [Rhizoctonia solani]|uniref:Cytochrome P450 family protein n=1 Tax=Rhizoctonia solani TaxID=456999 RepID=A0A8H8SVR3_9AGAM|nr:cytochrome P450 family protein [Rhizoctonia solani]QRW19764.1 cytochrome P450 family protein [Rhizoctonia solani]